MTNDPIRVAGIGAGYFSQFHYDAWARIPEAEVVGIADKNREAAEQRRQEAGLEARIFDDAEKMLAELQPELVDIATPPQTHEALIAAAFEAGAECVICQKPFCAELSAAERAAALADRYGRKLVVHENFRFQPWWRAIKRALDEQRCGKLRQVSFRLRPGDGQGPRAYLDRQPYFQAMPRFLVHETGVHWVDVFCYLLGAPQAVFADLRQLNPAIAGEDAGFFLFYYGDQTRALFDGNRLLDHEAENRRRTMGEALIEGDAAVLRLDGDGRVEIREHGQNRWSAVAFDAPETGFGGDCVHALQSHVVAALKGHAPLENQAADYLTVMRIEEAIYRSSETGARIAL